MRVVMKFGGTSMAGAERIRHAAGLARTAAPGAEVVAVVSAMDGVTERLLETAEAAAGGDRAGVLSLLATLRREHEGAARELGCGPAVEGLLQRLETLVGGVAALGELTARSRDAVVAFGERLGCAMMAAALGGPGLDGQGAGIVTDGHFGEAEPLMELSMLQVRQTLEPLLAKGERPTVAGFIAATQHGVTSTLGRGGSDYTATIVGAALRADEIWIWSDVDGLMTADPRVEPGARLLERITFAEAVEMGKFGAKSMHPRALEPAAAHGVPVRMRNTFRPQEAGTLISGAGEEGGGATGPVRAVPALKGMAMVTVGGAGMVGRPGTAAALFGALAEARVNVHMICQSVSEAGISIVVSGAQAERAKAALERALRGETFARRVEVAEGLCVVAAVGSGMRGTPGVAARLFTAVAARGVNVMAIAQGSSELSICFVVRQEEAAEAVRGAHGAFFPPA